MPRSPGTAAPSCKDPPHLSVVS